MVNTEEVAEEKAQALVVLAQNEGNIAKTSRETGVTPYHLRRLRNVNRDLYETVCRDIAAGILDKTLYLTDKYLDEIVRRADEGEISEMKTKELMVTAAIGVDKINVMTTVRGKFGGVQKAADSFDKMTDEEIAEAIDGDFTVEETNEGMSDKAKDELPDRPKRVSTFRSILRGRSDTGKP